MSTTPPGAAAGTPADLVDERGRRAFVPTLLLGVPAAGLAAVAANKPLLVSPMLSGDRFADAGEIPLAGSLALVPLAAWAALLLLRGRIRTLIAILGLAGSVGTLAAADAGLASTHDAMAKTFAELGQGGQFTAGYSAWFWVMGVASLLAALAFAVALRHVQSWPSLSRKYDAPSARRDPVEPHTSQELWKAIDDGRDPTARPTGEDN